VDPVNHLVAAHVEGNIGYHTRGYLPIPSSPAHRQFPVPGWTGENEWIGRVPHEELPRAINPPEGFIATANQAVLPDERIYIAHQFSSPSRAERIVELLTAQDVLSPDEIAAMQGDTTSRPARTWGRYLSTAGPFDGDAERARAMLAGFDGNLLPGSAPALLYGCFRRAAGKALFRPIVGEAAWNWLVAPETTVTHGMITRWMANVVDAVAHGGGAWTAALRDALPAALAEAWRGAVERCGPDPAQWAWASVHGTNARHTLLARFPQRAAELNPPPVSLGGDGDTIQATSYLWGDRPRFDIVGLSVYRQVVDLADVPHASYVIPGGVSGVPGVPGSPHFADQLDLWRTHQRIPMRYGHASAETAAGDTQVLRPAPA
jgi:penicillin amidase